MPAKYFYSGLFLEKKFSHKPFLLAQCFHTGLLMFLKKQIFHITKVWNNCIPGLSLLESGLVIGLGDPRNILVTAAINPRPRYNKTIIFPPFFKT